jgi:hypothetical protein
VDSANFKNSIIFELYNPSGLFNQVSSLENAIGLSYYFKKDLIIHNVLNPKNPHFDDKSIGIYSSNKWFNNRSFVDDSNNPKITDLLDFSPYSKIDFINDKLNIEDAQNYRGYFINCSEDISNEKYFSQGRNKMENSINLTCTIGWYSTYFMNRTQDIDFGINSVKFKKEYYELAEQIAKSIGDFSGAHIRLTDNQFDYPLKNQIHSGIEMLDQATNLVIATDHPSNEVVKELKGIILEEYISQNFYKDFLQFKFTDEVSFGLLCNLVMHYSKDFIGSQGSTFSGYIQRNIKSDIKLFGETKYVQDGPYSWNGYIFPTLHKNPRDMNPNDIQWWREWKESRLFPELV